MSLRCDSLTLGLGAVLAVLITWFGDEGSREPIDEPALLVEQVRPNWSLPARVELLADLEYAQPAGEPLRLDLYRPTVIEQPLPVVLWIHGGGWRSGSKAEPIAAELATRGYAVASIEYRSSDSALFPAQIDDCQAAVRWLRTHAAEYQLDPQRFAAWGVSSGAHLATLLGTMSRTGDGTGSGSSSSVQAVIDFSGPVDLLAMDEQAGANAAVQHNVSWSPESLLLGGPIQERVELATLANPLIYLQDDVPPPPFLVQHGRHDPLVPVRQSDQLVRALRRAGGVVEYQRLPEYGHDVQVSPDDLKLVADFLDRNLHPTEPSSKRRHPGPVARQPGLRRPLFLRPNHSAPAGEPRAST
jgi:acetyl esterase/lipase